MADIDIQIDPATLRQVEAMLRDVPRGVDKMLPGAINDTIKPVVSFIAKGVTKEVNVTQSAVKK